MSPEVIDDKILLGQGALRAPVLCFVGLGPFGLTRPLQSRKDDRN